LFVQGLNDVAANKASAASYNNHILLLTQNFYQSYVFGYAFSA